MPAKAKPVEQEMTLPLSAEDRRVRVQNVRALGADLEMVENALLVAQERLPKLLRDIARARKVIADNTAPASADEAS